MINFPLTQKRLLKQPKERRHRLVADWIEKLYLLCIKDKLNPNVIAEIESGYRIVLDWLGEPKASTPDIEDLDLWIEFFSDRFHYHKSQSGKGVSEHNLLPRVKKGDLQKNSPWTSSVSYSVALDNIRSAFNVGSIFRTADAAGFQGVIVGGSTPGIENNQVQKTSMGSSKWIPQQSFADLSQGLESLKLNENKIIGLETVENSTDHFSFPWPEKGILVLGNEEYGISKNVMKVCDDFVHIPMKGRKNSLNVASAFAVVAFHLSNLSS